MDLKRKIQSYSYNTDCIWQKQNFSCHGCQIKQSNMCHLRQALTTVQWLDGVVYKELIILILDNLRILLVTLILDNLRILLVTLILDNLRNLLINYCARHKKWQRFTVRKEQFTFQNRRPVFLAKLIPVK